MERLGTMMIRIALALLCFAAISVCTISNTQAAVILKIDPAISTVVSGQEVHVALILVDADGDVAADGGLLSGGGRLLVHGTSSATALITDISKISPNAGFALATTVYPFDQPFPNPAPGGFSQIGGFIGASQFDAAVLPNGNEIVLAEFMVQVTGVPGSSALVQPATLGGSFVGNVGFDTGVNFDTQVNTLIGARIIVVPEPHGAMVVCGVATVFGSIRRRRSCQAR